MDYCDTYSSFFKAARHNLSSKARCYLSGLLMKGKRIDIFFKGPPAPKWQKVFVRDSTKGRIEVQASARRVWLWDGQEQESRQWWAVCVINSDTAERKFFLSNAPASTSLAELVRKHAGRYWIERSFQDAKTSRWYG